MHFSRTSLPIMRESERRNRKSIAASLVLLATLCAIGCNGTSSIYSSTAVAPALTVAGPLNAYAGAESTGDVWQITINHNTNSFSAIDYSEEAGTSGSPLTFNGEFAFDGGFLDFSQTNTASNAAFEPSGFALEIPGRVVLFRPDTATDLNGNPAAAPPVAAVPGGCWSFVMGVNFQFVTMPNVEQQQANSIVWNPATNSAYGGFQVSTDGTTWYFFNLSQFTLAQGPSQPGANFSPGLCAPAIMGTVISIPANSQITTTDTLVVGPSGFLILNQGPGVSGALGLGQPAGALNTSNLVSVHYLGFVSEPSIPFPSCAAPCTPTAPPPNPIASFGPCPDTICSPGTSLLGGDFPLANPMDSRSDDPTQPANTNITINLGAQNATSNGLYDAATVTIPDPNSVCTGSAVGQDSQGNPTCTFPAVAVAGNPESKYAIFLIAQDIVNQSPMSIYLFQE
jgi:hypothetical protein